MTNKYFRELFKPLSFSWSSQHTRRHGYTSVVNNAVANAFTDAKKLKYGTQKCKKLHIGKQSTLCPDLKVHDEKLTESESETYLGEIISNTGRLRANIQSRRDKGFGCVAEIMSILSEIPLGKY